jgi:hypothetical protein
MKAAIGTRLRAPVLAGILLLGIAVLRGETPAANSPAPAPSAPITDPAQVAEYYRQVLARPQFQETEEPAVNAQLKDWLSQWFNRFGATIGNFNYASRMPAFESLLMTVLAVFSTAVLLYIMVRLTRRRTGLETERNAGPPGQKVFRAPEFYDDEIRAAVRSGDWQAAWLSAWRQFLSRLEHRQWVEADRTRTNREYLAQLGRKPLPGSALALLTGMVDAYDRFIYGRRPIGEPDWDLFRRQLDEAGLLLHLEEKRKTAPARPEPS